MSIGTIITWLLGLIRLLTGRSSSRIKLDVRSEAAIKGERERRDKLWARIVGIDNELTETIQKILRAKKAGGTALESRLNDKRDKLFQQFQDAKREYDDAKRHSD